MWRIAGMLLGAAAVGLVLPAPPATGHLAAPTRTLRQLVADATWAGRVRISDAASRVRIGGSLMRPVVHAVVLEALKGEAPPGTVLRFAQHGHGAAEFREGDDGLLFLQPLASHVELARTGLSQAVEWVSLQEHGARWSVAGDGGEAVLAAARAWAALAARPAAQRPGARVRIATRLLASRDPRLAADALRDLALAPELPLATVADLPSLRALVDDPARDPAHRAGVLVLLEGHGLGDESARWLRLLGETRGAARETVIERAAPRVPASPALFESLRALLADEDVRSAAAAARALGTPGDDGAVEALSAALASPSPRVRGAAVRALGRIGTLRARDALLEAAGSHADPDTRRRARAAAARLGGAGASPR